MQDSASRRLPPRLAALLALLPAACAPGGLEYAEEAAAGASLELEPVGTISFGTVSPYGRAAEQELVARSTGDADVLLVSAWIEGDPAFSVRHDPTPVRLPPGHEVRVVLAFAPDELGDYEGSFQLDTNLDEPPLIRGLRGRGCSDRDRNGVCDHDE